MKRSIPLIFISLVVGAGGIWLSTHGSLSVAKADADEEKKPAAATEEADKVTISHDTNGNVVVGMSDKIQGSIGLVVTNPTAAQYSPELKAYGRIVDPAPVAAGMADLATAQASYAASSNELARSRTLNAQANMSARALEAAEAAAVKDQLTAQTARDHLVLSFGETLADRASSPDFVRALTSLDSVLVRVDVPAGDVLKDSPTGARIVRLDNSSADADFLCMASGVDPQVQGHGFIFYIPKNSEHFLAAEAVTAYLKLPGQPTEGVVIPRDAIVRVEGKGWIYVLNDGGASFTRTEIPLDRPVDDGWFVTNVTAGQRMVVTGAQVLLSEELKASMSPD